MEGLTVLGVVAQVFQFQLELTEPYVLLCQLLLQPPDLILLPEEHPEELGCREKAGEDSGGPGLSDIPSHPGMPCLFTFPMPPATLGQPTQCSLQLFSRLIPPGLLATREERIESLLAKQTCPREASS